MPNVAAVSGVIIVSRPLMFVPNPNPSARTRYRVYSPCRSGTTSATNAVNIHDARRTVPSRPTTRLFGTFPASLGRTRGRLLSTRCDHPAGAERSITLPGAIVSGGLAVTSYSLVHVGGR